MSAIKKIFLVVISLSFVGGCATSKPLNNVPLVWKPTSDVGLGSVSLSDVSGVIFAVPKFEDERTNKNLIGTNMESSPGKTVTTSENVALWSTSQFIELMKKHGLKVSETGNVNIIGEIVDFNVNEVSDYKARVAIRIKAVDSSGATLWDGLMDGTTTRFGRSYSLDNYYETLTDAFIHGYRDLMTSTSFLESMKSMRSEKPSSSKVSKVSGRKGARGKKSK